MRAINQPHLITIGVSHFCEKARWALDHAGVAFEEDAHAPVFHTRAARRHSPKTSTPILLIDGRTLADSTAILEYLDERLTPERALYPRDPLLRADVAALEDDFDDRLGPHARRLSYFHVLPHSRAAVAALGINAPARERRLLPFLFPLVLRVGIRRSLRIDAAGAERSREKVQAVFDLVSDRLSDGRPFLVGGRFTAADLTFAALSAPLLWLGPYAVLPPPSSISPALGALYEQLAGSRAGQFARRMHDEHRRRAS